MKPLVRTIFTIVSALLLTAAFPRPGWEILAWVAFVPFFYALKETRFWQGVGLGVLFGLVHFAAILYWVGYPVYVYAHMPMWAAVGAVFLLSLILSMYMGLFGGACSLLLPRPVAFLLAAPVFFLATEYLRATLFSGFPWALLGASQAEQLRILQIADIFGVWGISFLIILGNISIYLMIQSYITNGRTLAQGERATLLLVFIFPFLLAVSIFYGNYRIASIHEALQNAPSVQTAILQGNIQPSLKWDQDHQVRSVQTYIRLGTSPLAQKADLVVLPETAMAFQLHHEKAIWSLVQEVVFPAKAWFVLGAPHWEEINGQRHYYNSAFLANPNGDLVARYDKAHLVPFGEYAPPIPLGGKVGLPGGSDFTPGVPGRVLQTDKAVLGPQICYEIIFPVYSRLATQNGADILVNLTEDGWYGDTAGPRQHFAMVILRTVENRRSLVRAANTGISGFILPTGESIANTKLNEEAVVMAKLPILTTTTIYQKMGDILPQTCTIIFVVWLVAQVVFYVRRKQNFI